MARSIFEAAQAACEQYIENVRMLNERQDALYRQFAFEKKSVVMECEETDEEETVLPEPISKRRRMQRRLGNV